VLVVSSLFNVLWRFGQIVFCVKKSKTSTIIRLPLALLCCDLATPLVAAN